MYLPNRGILDLKQWDCPPYFAFKSQHDFSIVTLISVMSTGNSQQHLSWRGSFNVSGPAYLFYPFLSIWLFLISQMGNDILYQGCWILLRKGITTALPASQTSTGLMWQRWALHQCWHQAPFLRRWVATLDINDVSTCLSYGPRADTCR